MSIAVRITVTALAGLALAASPAHAITNGEPDGARHPNVGAVLADLPGIGRVPLCSGVLVSPTVFLTAGHCTAPLPRLGAARVWVTLDAELDPSRSALIGGSYRTHPRFGHDAGDLHDLAVVLLDDAVATVRPASLPEPRLLDRIPRRDALFASVGFGVHTRITGGGPPSFLFDGLRRVSYAPIAALTPSSLRLLAAEQATGLGGVCYGDSGGPQFVGDSNTIVAVTSGGSAACEGMSSSYRLDTPGARAFLAEFVALPRP